MLDIPDSVKALFLRDGVRKHFRAVFDDGTPDITNSNIVWESLRLRESVSSSDSIAFGASEAPMLEFETVGVPNIRGKWFTAWLEIDASGIDAEYQQHREDVPYPVYPVALGRFVVSSCPRNQEAMAHRAVTALASGLSGAVRLSPALESILAAKWAGIKNEKFLLPVALSNFGVLAEYEQANPERISTIVQIPKNVGADADIMSVGSLRNLRGVTAGVVEDGLVLKLPDYPGQVSRYSDIPLLGAYIVHGFYIDNPGPRDAYSLYRADGDFQTIAREDLSELLKSMAQQLAELHPGSVYLRNQDGSYSDHALSQSDIADWLLNQFNPLQCLAPLVSYSMISSTGAGTSNAMPLRLGQWFPGFQGTRKARTYVTFRVPVAVGLTDDSIHPLIDSASWGSGKITMRVQQYTAPAAPTAIESIQFLQSPSDGSDGTDSAFRFQRSDLETALKAMLELRGSFGQAARNGDSRLMQLQTEPVWRFTPEHFESAWWDDYDLEPIGAVAYRLNGQDMLYRFGTGRSVYTLSCDDFLQNIAGLSESRMTELLDDGLVPALQALTFTPARIIGRGLPFLEAGDRIAIEAMDGTVTDTYLLQREMRGLQLLRDTITADGVTVVEVEQ